LVNIYLSITLK